MHVKLLICYNKHKASKMVVKPIEVMRHHMWQDKKRIFPPAYQPECFSSLQKSLRELFGTLSVRGITCNRVSWYEANSSMFNEYNKNLLHNIPNKVVPCLCGCSGGALTLIDLFFIQLYRLDVNFEIVLNQDDK